ncbi:uncharacterized protein FTOL_11049 [Fusarium torulosum]|uniref:BTB domain-containing protein n=1 Tax=Fusarium torulosum TaxID=33205 RepID=A0AAE8MHZ7_9HYPO|nr:uncharacterized protein FTOL_11049 [Fusarium torulosum]
MASQAHAFLFSMVETGEFSDFTLVCDGCEFKLHQVVVCPQSLVIAAALCGGFKETTSKVITVSEFDISTVRYMISFLYTGEYKVGTKSEDSLLPGDEQCHDEADNFSQPCSGSESMKNETTENILSHLRVNAIADYYNVNNLARLANSKIKTILKQDQEADLFPRVIQEMSKSNRDAELCAMVASATAERMGDLIKLQDFQDVELEHTLVLGIFNALSTKIKVVQSQLDASQRLTASLVSIATNESERKRLFEERVDHSLSQLENTKICRHCAKDFGCIFEKRGPGSPVSHVLRCRDCRCRHP